MHGRTNFHDFEIWQKKTLAESFISRSSTPLWSKLQSQMETDTGSVVHLVQWVAHLPLVLEVWGSNEE